MRKLTVLILMLAFGANASAKELSMETSNSYLDALGVQGNLKATYEVMINPLLDGVLRGIAQNMKSKGLPDTKIVAAVNAMRPHVMSAKTALLDNLDNLMPYQRLQAEVYHPVLSASFTEEELREVIAFLQTPVGRKYSQETYTILQQTSQLTQQLFGPQIEKFFSEEMARRREQAIHDITAALEATQ